MIRPILFLDDGGVLNDNRLRGPQWQRLVGEYFAPKLGGEPGAWAEANRIVATGFFAPGAWQARLLAAADYASFDYVYHRDWIKGMCEIVGVPPLPEREGVAMARQANAWIIPQVKASIPGAAETVRLLHRRGYTLYTASGSSSTDLRAHLGSMGILDCFKRLYGPDLIDAFKSGPKFYRRLLADARVAPSEALVLDDSPDAVEWATEVGARAVLVASDSRARTDSGILAIKGLSELPGILGV
jgi:HAD superfamily hydrolase (TIGR01509 family)